MDRTAGSRTVVVRGTGSIGRRHLRVLRERLGVTAVAFPARAERAAQLTRNGIEAVRDLAELETHRPDLAVVATNTARHLPDALELLRFGNILIEKPIAPSTSGLSDLESAAAAASRKLYVGFCLRFDQGLQRFREMLPDLGQVDAVRIECRSYLPDWRPETDYRESYSASSSEGGVLRDLSHEIDYAVWLFGRPSQVCCVFSNTDRLGIHAEEACDMLWRVPNGALVSLRLDYLSRIPRRRMTATGEHGELMWDGIEGEVCLTDQKGRSGVAQIHQDRDDMMACQADAFLSATAGRDPGPLATFEEGAFVVALSDAARRSSQEERFVSIADWRSP